MLITPDKYVLDKNTNNKDLTTHLITKKNKEISFSMTENSFVLSLFASMGKNNGFPKLKRE